MNAANVCMACAIFCFIGASFFLALAMRSAQRERAAAKARKQDYKDAVLAEIELHCGKRVIAFSPLDVLLMDDDHDLRKSHAPGAAHSKWEVN